jgi:hypothetical protein
MLAERPANDPHADLPHSVAEIADVIGRPKALVLAGACGGVLYVPQRLTPEHKITKLIGREHGDKLVQAYGGCVVYLATCAKLRAGWRDQAILRWHERGVSRKALAELTGLTERHVANVLKSGNPAT